MRNPFRRRARETAGPVLEDMRSQIRQIEARFHRLEESMDRFHAKLPQVTIEHVHIHQPVLEKLEFRLDALDIEQLSGSLNLGNNFGAKIQSEQPERKPGKSRKQPESPPSAPASADPGLHRTPSGYHLNNRR